MKIRLALALFLVFILATTALGCDKIKGSGVFYDGDTGDPVEFKVNLVTGKTNAIWTDVMGSIHLDDESKGVKVRGGSDMYFNIGNEFYAYDVTVNGKHGYWIWFWYCDYYDPPYFWFTINTDDTWGVYEWWGWEHEVEGDIIIKD